MSNPMGLTFLDPVTQGRTPLDVQDREFPGM
jgi:hypothetical protein